MKQAFASILLMIYFVVSTGFTVNMHYCMDKLHSWELGATENEKCGECGMETKANACCRDEVKVIKLQQDVYKAQAIAYNFSLPVLVANTTSFLLLPFQNVQSEAVHFSHGPPLLNKQDAYLLNCVFRI